MLGEERRTRECELTHERMLSILGVPDPATISLCLAYIVFRETNDAALFANSVAVSHPRLTLQGLLALLPGLDALYVPARASAQMFYDDTVHFERVLRP